MSVALSQAEDRLVDLLTTMGTVNAATLEGCVEDVLARREAGQAVELGALLVERGHVSRGLIEDLLGDAEDRVFAGEAGEYEGTPDPDAIARRRRSERKKRVSARAKRRSGQSRALPPEPDPDEGSSLPQDVETRRFDLEALAAASAAPAPKQRFVSPHLLGGMVLVIAVAAIGGVASLQPKRKTKKPPPPPTAPPEDDPFTDDEPLDDEPPVPENPLVTLEAELEGLEQAENYAQALALLAQADPLVRKHHGVELTDAERRLAELEAHRKQVARLLEGLGHLRQRNELETAVAALTEFAAQHDMLRESPAGRRLDDALYDLSFKLEELRSIPTTERRAPRPTGEVPDAVPAERAERFAVEAKRGRQIVASIRAAIAKDTAEAERAHGAQVAEARKRSKAEPLELELLPNYRLRAATVADFNRSSFTLLNQGDRLTYSWDSVDPAAAFEIRSLGAREGHAEDQLRLGRWCLERRLFAEARTAFGKAVLLNPALKAQVPDVASVSRAVRIFSGKLVRGGSTITVTYEFSRAAQGNDWEFPAGARCGVDPKAGRMHLAGKGVYLATFKEVGFSDSLSIQGTVGPVGRGSSAVLGVSFGSGASTATTYLASVAQGSGDVLLARRRRGKVKVLERRNGAAGDGKVRFSLEVQNDKVRVRVGARTVCRATVDEGWTRTRVHVGGASDARGGASFDEVVVKGRVRSAWLRKAFGEFDARLAGVLARTEDLRVFAKPAGKPARRPLSAEDGFGMREVSKAAQAEYAQGRVRAERPSPVSRLEALTAFGNALELSPRFAAASYRRARILASVGRVQSALGDLEDAIEHCPQFFEAHAERARLLARQGQLERAREDVGLALTIRPDYAEAYSARALISFLEGDLEAALADLDVALALDPWSDDVRAFRRNVGNAIKGPPWARAHEEKTEHYLVRTNISAARCADYAQELEAIRGFYAQQFATDRRANKRAMVLIFDTREGFQSYAQLTTDDRVESLMGCFLPRYQQLLLYEDKDDASLEETRSVLYHEAFHQFISSLIPDMPYWLNEGFADYFSTARVEGGTVKGKGSPIPGRLADLRRFVRAGGPVPFPRLMQETPAEFYSGKVAAKYAQAWSMVHFFIHGAPAGLKKRFRLYVRALRQGKGSRSAFKLAFDGLEWPSVERAWREHVGRL